MFIRRIRSIILVMLWLWPASLHAQSACTTTPSPSVLESMQGRWSGVFISVTEVGINGDTCGDGTVQVEAE
jgi:hypothetical protein